MVLFSLLAASMVGTAPAPGGMELAKPGFVVSVTGSSTDYPGVLRAVTDLGDDFGRVTGQRAPVLLDQIPRAKIMILVGTVGKNPWIDRLVSTGRVDGTRLKGAWETYQIVTVDEPFPGVDQALVIAGSDKRGTIFGVYELSRQLGVSPWYWWADATPLVRPTLWTTGKIDVLEGPSVKYRGIFLNDEYPALSRWVSEKFGSTAGVARYDHRFYSRIFELLLRLKANYLWPAMWGNAFNEDDPENPRLADEYGIVMGTSHQEPMMRAQQEWDRRYHSTLGHWNYANQAPVLEEFWKEGVDRNKGYENLVTIGLRGANDTEMAPGGPGANRGLLEQIIQRQRDILTEVTGRPASAIPQVWCLYKEVLDYYRAGMKVPDDVTLLWADDNWGNLTRLPTPEERARAGGAGIYYHFDYHGGPRSYQWVNTSPIQKIWDQMSLAKQYGADRVWIVNVGHLKGYELPTSFFMDLAWNPGRYTAANLDAYTSGWARQLFGEAGPKAAELLDAAARFNGRRKPELLSAETFSPRAFGEAQEVVARWQALADEAQNLAEQVPGAQRDAYYSLVLFPIRASATLNELYGAAGLNSFYATQERSQTNVAGDQVQTLFSHFQSLMDEFNTQFAGGKWNHFMDQAVLGYQSWNDPSQNNLDHLNLRRVTPESGAVLGVGVEGTAEASATFDCYRRQSHFVEIYNRGTAPFDYRIEATEPWLIVQNPTGRVETQTKTRIAVDWAKVPPGVSTTTLRVEGAGSEEDVTVRVMGTDASVPKDFHGFVELDGYLAVEAADFSASQGSEIRRWTKIPGYGRTGSGMRAELETDVPPLTPGPEVPELDYSLWFRRSGAARIVLTLSPSLNVRPGRDVEIAVGLDDQEPQILTVVPQGYVVSNQNADWARAVSNEARQVSCAVDIPSPGSRTLKVWALDPGVVFERFTVDFGGIPSSYLGPPESPRRP